MKKKMIIVSVAVGIVLFGTGLFFDGGLTNCSIATALCPYLCIPAMLVWMRYWKRKYQEWSLWLNMFFSSLIPLAGLFCFFLPLKVLNEDIEVLIVLIAAGISLAAVMGAMEILFRIIDVFEPRKTE